VGTVQHKITKNQHHVRSSSKKRRALVCCRIAQTTRLGVENPNPRVYGVWSRGFCPGVGSAHPSRAGAHESGRSYHVGVSPASLPARSRRRVLFSVHVHSAPRRRDARERRERQYSLRCVCACVCACMCVRMCVFMTSPMTTTTTTTTATSSSASSTVSLH
jgi:hypothetical protein